jgi:hypothetical protein
MSGVAEQLDTQLHYEPFEVFAGSVEGGWVWYPFGTGLLWRLRLTFQRSQSVDSLPSSSELLLQIIRSPGRGSFLRVQDCFHQGVHLVVGRLEGGVRGEGFV